MSTQSKTKTSRREIPLCDSVIKLLLLLKENNSKDQLIFHNKNNDIVNNKVLNKALKNLIIKLNAEEKKTSDKDNEYVPFPMITSHSFRHTFATRCFESGINGKVVQKYLGHSSLSMTMDLYTHVNENLMAENIAKIDNLF